MPIIKPITELKTKTAEISTLAKKVNEPIFLTKNGEGDLVVMSMEYFHAEQRRQEMALKVLESELAFVRGDRGREATEVFSDIRRKIRK